MRYQHAAIDETVVCNVWMSDISALSFCVAVKGWTDLLALGRPQWPHGHHLAAIGKGSGYREKKVKVSNLTYQWTILGTVFHRYRWDYCLHCMYEQHLCTVFLRCCCRMGGPPCTWPPSMATRPPSREKVKVSKPYLTVDNYRQIIKYRHADVYCYRWDYYKCKTSVHCFSALLL